MSHPFGKSVSRVYSGGERSYSEPIGSERMVADKAQELFPLRGQQLLDLRLEMAGRDCFDRIMQILSQKPPGE